MRKLITLIVALLMAISAHADEVGIYSFLGTLGEKIPVLLRFAVNDDDIAVGEIIYTKHNISIMVVGGVLNDDGWYYLNEYQPDGTITGMMTFKIESNENERVSLTNGTWRDPKTETVYQMKDFEDEEDASYGVFNVTDYLDYADPEDIGSYYAYSVWNSNSQSMVGGHVTFSKAGKYLLNFEVCNAPSGMAEFKNDPNRPAVLGKYTYNWFTYENVNECGYGFSAHFFKKFVVLKSMTGNETLGCFGSGAAADGVYIKKK